MAEGRIENLQRPKSDLTADELRAKMSAMGKASGKARAEKAEIKQILLDSFHNAEVGTDKHGQPITGAQFTAGQIVAGIKKGNIKYIEMYLAMIGQKPADKMELSGQVNTNTELKAIMQQLGGDYGED